MIARLAILVISPRSNVEEMGMPNEVLKVDEKDLDVVAQAKTVVVDDFDALRIMQVEIDGIIVQTNCDDKED